MVQNNSVVSKKLDDYVFESNTSLNGVSKTSAKPRRLEDVMTSSSMGVTWSGSQSNIASFSGATTTVVAKTGEEVVIPKVCERFETFKHVYCSCRIVIVLYVCTCTST